MISRMVAAACAAMGVFFSSAGLAADYKIDGERLTVSGRLYGDREFDSFSALIRNNPNIKIVVMKNFYGGIRMSGFLNFTKFIRDNGLATEVDGPCISACATAFLGGVRRGIAPTADPKRTFVAFHGTYRAGRRSEFYEQTYINALHRYSGGRMSLQLAKQAYQLPQKGYLAFFDAKRHKREDGTSVFLCDGSEARKTRDCEGLKNVDAYSAGVFTR